MSDSTPNKPSHANSSSTGARRYHRRVDEASLNTGWFFALCRLAQPRHVEVRHPASGSTITRKRARQDHPSMTLSDVMETLHKHQGGLWDVIYLNKFEHGQIKPTPSLLRQLAVGYRLTPFRFAIAEHHAGFVGGIPAFLCAEEWGIDAAIEFRFARANLLRGRAVIKVYQAMLDEHERGFQKWRGEVKRRQFSTVIEPLAHSLEDRLATVPEELRPHVREQMHKLLDEAREQYTADREAGA